ncbi:hypothetical protein BP6252_05617 [Coleophoma cylindrospora]|uniref:Uncharacterized protein n=1 Tax=Coleophoma cylindrospora TaxID=1849047 RepID=A0A3D8RUN0_9HELO|nr:hypothetical protein BP6252_05617 [Coleophoma cylindrospora]
MAPTHLTEYFARAVLEARDNKSFWDKYKWLIIGGAIAMPFQLVGLWWFLRRRKAKKAIEAQKNGSTNLNPYASSY